MSLSFTYNETVTFTATHAKYLASKVTTDLMRLQRFYGEPSEYWIQRFELELIELLKGGYLKEVTYGFQRDGKWIAPTLIYTAKELTLAAGTDDDPGRIKPGADISGATFGSYLIRTTEWHSLSESARNSFEDSLPFKREGAVAPAVNGYVSSDLSYSSGGRALNRSIIKSF